MISIYEKFELLKNNNLFLGTPLHEERYCQDGIGKYITYCRESDNSISSIHWHPDIGCFETHGAIRMRWEILGFEGGLLGYPKSDEYTIDFNLMIRSFGWVSDDGEPIPEGENIQISSFENGSITWSPSSNEAIAYFKNTPEILKTRREKLLDKIYSIFPNI